MSNNKAYDSLWLVLKQSRPIAFGLFLARMAGNPKAAILLSQLAHWTRTGRDVAQTNGWLFKTQQQWWLETGLSRAELDTARRRLRNLGLIEETLAGRPATLWYRLKLPNIARALEVCRKQSLPAELTFEFMRTPERAVRDLLGPTTAYHRILADVTGSVNAGLLLSRLLQLQRRSLDTGHAWFSLTASNWQEDLALNRRSLENAKGRLKELKLVHEFHVNRGAKRVYTQVDPAVLVDLLQAHFAAQPDKLARAAVDGIPTTGRHQEFQVSHGPAAESQTNPAVAEGYVRNQQAGNAQEEYQDCGKRTLQMCGKVHSSLLETSTSISSKNTSTTTNTTTTHAGAREASVLQQNVVVVGIEDFAWPETLAEDSRLGALKLLGSAPQRDRQPILDEFAARSRRQAIANPLGYLRQLVLLAQQALFVPEVAHFEARQRQNQQAIAASVAQAQAQTAARLTEGRVTSKTEGRAHTASLLAALAQGRRA